MQASSKSFHVDAAAHLIVLVRKVGDFGDGLAVYDEYQFGQSLFHDASFLVGLLFLDTG